MDLQELIQCIEEDSDKKSRFPSRLILTDSFRQYQEVYQYLDNRCDKHIKLSDYCIGKDTIPDFKALFKEIKESDDNKWLLTGIGEYLRLMYGREESMQAVYSLVDFQTYVNAKTKVYIPIFASKMALQHSRYTADIRRQDFNWELDGTSDKEYRLTVCSTSFIEVLPKSLEIIDGIKEWLNVWEKTFSNSEVPIVVTQFAKYTEDCGDCVDLRIYKDTMQFVKERLTDGYFNAELGNVEQWASIISYLDKPKTLKTVIKEILNFSHFSSLDELAKWDLMDKQKRWLFWLWYQIQPSDDYIGQVVARTADYQKIPDMINLAIFDLDYTNDDLIRQRQDALKALKLNGQNAEFFRRFDSIKDDESRLKLLSGYSEEEKAMIIQVVGHWLKQGADRQYIVERIEEKYPALAVYLLNECDVFDERIKHYFDWYTVHKLSNELPERAVDEEIFNITDQIDTYPMRYKVIKPLADETSVLLWIDAMGAEWLPMLMEGFKGLKRGQIESSVIAQATLPTETIYNNNWEGIENEKLGELDKLIHNGVVDERSYYVCVREELKMMDKVVHKVDLLLNKYDRVILTGDHGASRLAARAFHKKGLVVNLPNGAVAKAHGRYIVADQNIDFLNVFSLDPFIRVFTDEKKNYAVMKNYRHFLSSGNVAGSADDDVALPGEIHGGATPEEMLVPVISIVRKRPLPPKFKADEKVYLKKGKCSITLKFTKDVDTLCAKVKNQSGHAVKSDPRTWIVTFEGMSEGQCQMMIVANNYILEEQAVFTVEKRGIKTNDPFGGFI